MSTHKRRIGLFIPPLALVPLTILLWISHAPPLILFLVAGVTILPLAYVMGVSTEELGKQMGPGLGGLLNASFGNATEIIIAIAALRAGLVRLVQASITGSIIGNILLILGLSMLVGGLRFKKQSFARKAASTRSTMLVLATIGLVIPSLFLISSGQSIPEGAIASMSIWISVLLLIAYGGGLLFSLHTHRHIFNPPGEEEEPEWSRGYALLVLGGAMALVALMSEVFIEAVEASIETIGLNELFLGVVVIAVVGNAAEHSSAVMMAWKNKMNLSVAIAASSSTQIALFVAPILVFVSILIGNTMTLAFDLFELIAIGLSVAVVSAVANDGESNWFEGLMLLIVYGIIAVGFFYLP
ncbi:MAG: calcium/proton exchanger [Candidatus Thermoplasmatota archaeon]|nr:calcium/proton exchanger [Candidatus Thermoplasmatota archaeon]